MAWSGSAIKRASRSCWRSHGETAMPYIMIDAAGIKELFKSDQKAAIDKCQHFWELIKNKALQDDMGSRYVTFSDSALIYIPQNDTLSGVDLVRWIQELLDQLKDKIGTEFYAIANSGFEAGPSDLHGIIADRLNSDYEPRYVHIAGLGDDFTNLFFAEDIIRKKRRNGKISADARVYINTSLLTEVENNNCEYITVKGLGGEDQRFLCMQ